MIIQLRNLTHPENLMGQFKKVNAVIEGPRPVDIIMKVEERIPRFVSRFCRNICALLSIIIFPYS